MTLLLGVLQARAVRFEPELEEKREALSQLVPAPIVRVVLRFRSTEALERLLGEPRYRASFLHTHDADVPIWWTSYPVVSPILTGWTDGPGAARLAHSRGRELVHGFVDALARGLRVKRARLDSAIAEAFTHDWLRDPFARGAYAYARVGGANAPRRLAASMGRVLFFAGEATNDEGHTGTVHGAIATGKRAAREARRVLGT